jgi:pectinesterase
MRYLPFLLWIVCTTGAKAQTANPQQYKYNFTVAKDGSGEYTTIQDAIDAIRVYPLAPITLYIKNGVYNEKIELPANNTDVTFIGESVDSTIISFGDYSGKGKHTTFTSYTAKISGNRFKAQNITFVNSAGRVGQALALYVDADKAVFVNCKFLGNQDTIFTAGETSRQLFYNCYIEGTTDFIFGPSTAVFQSCTIRAKANSYITAASTTPGKQYGYVFLDCTILADSGVTKVYLGRPWRAAAKTAFIRCQLPKAIAPEGWNNWGNPANEKTVFYAEYKNTGEGAATKNRVAWSHQLTAKEAAAYTPEKIFKWENNSTEAASPAWYVQTAVKPFQFNPADKPTVSELPLYKGAVPNSFHRNVNEVTTKTGGTVTRVAKVTIPTLTLYKPVKPNGQAVIICPGGGYAYGSFSKEGTLVAEQLSQQGITAFVLKYRLPDDSLQPDKSLAPLQDAQQAIRFVRASAATYKLDPSRIGIMGFSAGGHLAASAATHFTFRADATNKDTTSSRPDFSVFIYPVISFDSVITHSGSRNNLIGTNPSPEKVVFFSNETQVSGQTPPAFLVHAGDDKSVPVENSIRYYQACIKNGVPAEMHLYPRGGHGFGMYNKTTGDDWMERLYIWLKGLK